MPCPELTADDVYVAAFRCLELAGKTFLVNRTTYRLLFDHAVISDNPRLKETLCGVQLEIDPKVPTGQLWLKPRNELIRIRMLSKEAL